MNLHTKYAVTVLILLGLLSGQDRQEAVSAAEKMEYDYWFKHVQFFADDELKGRDTGSEEYAIAADYTAREFRENGLEPAGDDGTYFQDILFEVARMNKPSFDLRVVNEEKTITGSFGENISVFLNTDYDSFSDSLELVFVGYGNILPEEGINDYEGLDVEGKMVVVASGGPKGLKEPLPANPMVKIRNAEDNGAVGILLFVPGKGLFQKMIFEGFHGFVGGKRLRISLKSMSRKMMDLEIAAFAKQSFIRKLLRQNGMKYYKTIWSMKKGFRVSQELDSHIYCSYDMDFEPFDCKNVVAELPGVDPQLKNEYIVVGAHLDHVGIGQPVKGDSIKNGMWDNASGAAATISIAKAFQESGIKPKRSIIFINYTAEEKGLFGSHYHANSDLVKDKDIVANVNIDMLGGLWETTDVVPIGYSHSNISEAVDFAVEKLGLTVSDAEADERAYIERSDQYSYLKNGIPVVYIGSGIKAVEPDIDVEEEYKKWMKKYYHTPFDDLDQDFSKEAFHMALKVNFLTTYYLANEIDSVKWNEDSWIYEKYVEELED